METKILNKPNLYYRPAQQQKYEFRFKYFILYNKFN